MFVGIRNVQRFHINTLIDTRRFEFANFVLKYLLHKKPATSKNARRDSPWPPGPQPDLYAFHASASFLCGTTHAPISNLSLFLAFSAL